MLWNGDQSPRVKKERNPTLRGKWENAISGKHMENVPEETRVVSVMTQMPMETGAKIMDTKDDRLLLHPIRRQNRLTARAKILTVVRQESYLDKNEIPCRFNFFQKKKFGHVNSGILPCV